MVCVSYQTDVVFNIGSTQRVKRRQGAGELMCHQTQLVLVAVATGNDNGPIAMIR